MSYHILRCTPFSFSGLYLQKIASFFKHLRYTYTAWIISANEPKMTKKKKNNYQHFDLRCNSQWITVNVGSKVQLNKISKKTYGYAAGKQIMQSPGFVSSCKNGQTNPKVGVRCESRDFIWTEDKQMKECEVHKARLEYRSLKRSHLSCFTKRHAGVVLPLAVCVDSLERCCYSQLEDARGCRRWRRLPVADSCIFSLFRFFFFP